MFNLEASSLSSVFWWRYQWCSTGTLFQGLEGTTLDSYRLARGMPVYWRQMIVFKAYRGGFSHQVFPFHPSHVCLQEVFKSCRAACLGDSWSTSVAPWGLAGRMPSCMAVWWLALAGTFKIIMILKETTTTFLIPSREGSQNVNSFPPPQKKRGGGGSPPK